MLMHDLGFRAPRRDEEERILARRASGAFPRSDPTRFWIPAAVLSAKPLISYSGMVASSLLGVADLDAASLRKRPAWFLISPTWSIEEARVAEGMRARAVLHRLQSPHHKLIFACNTPEETGLMQQYGEAAFFYNKTANTSERIFRPLDGARLEFDAVYNAQLVPWKRHELSLGIATCAFLFYRDYTRPNAAAAEAAIIARHAIAPGHAFINPYGEDGQPVRLPLSEVNRHLNRAGVGLCLSEREGAMFASTEYLLAGLPIVTTPSTGGRHVYHDEEYCWTVPADPGPVADAVRALTAKHIPRGHVRQRTLQRIEADRERFLALLNAILEEERARRRLAKPWPFRKDVTMDWMLPVEAVDRAVHGVVDGFDRNFHRPFLWRLRRRALRLRRKYLGG